MANQIAEPKFYLDGADKLTHDMFWSNNYQYTAVIEEADLVVFVGGADVDPRIYQHVRHPMTKIDYKFDSDSLKTWRMAEGKPKVGICRGAQFLNVMNGGILYQHVDGHNLGLEDHRVFDEKEKGRSFDVTSDHHQMMLPTEEGDILLTAQESKVRELEFVGQDDPFSDVPDIECVYYSTTNSLCFQPHPEWCEFNSDCQNWFFNAIIDYLEDQ